jgi:membrane-bound lytic murein transglycosylase A
VDNKKIAMPIRHGFAWLLALFTIAGCQTVSTPPQEVPPLAPPATIPQTPTAKPVIPPSVEPGQPAPATSQLKPAEWADLSGWGKESVKGTWPAFLQSCAGLGNQPAWQNVCKSALGVNIKDVTTQQHFFEQFFRPFAVVNPDNSLAGTITGYYEPLIKGDRKQTQRARYPIYGVPDDLIVVDLAGVYPELKNLRLRGRLDGNRLVPYFNRTDIENTASTLRAKSIAWAEDPVDLFFLQIQGSGRIELPNGEHMRIGYADQNGHPYKSIGKLLVERGEMKLEEASMQSIKAWGKNNPDKLPELLASNPSYVFFRELPNGLNGPLGSLGVPLTPGHSIAVDTKFIPQGAPVFLSTTYPLSNQPLNRLVMAQDTGGAITGAVRADLFWGFGDEAGEQAGKMKQSGRLWVLLPKGFPVMQTAIKSP